MKLHKILFGIIILGMIVSGLIIFLSQGTEIYPRSDFNETQLESYNSMEELNVQLEEYKDNEGNVGAGDSSDILGSFFTSAYQSARIFKGSTTVLGNMVEDGTKQTGILGSYGQLIKTGLISLIGLAFLVGIFLHFITKSERT